MPSDKPSPTPSPSDGGTRLTPRPDDGGPARKNPRMGRYELVRHIATGGMGKVFLARDTIEKRSVALKILEKEMAAKPAMLERFKREIRSALKLKHENVVTVYEAGEVGGYHFVAMEYVDGIDLHDYVKRKGALDPEEARQIVLQAARALQHAAELSIVHRDVKPSNFLIVLKKGRPLVKLIDFGLAREVSADEFRVTRAGTTVGTVDYMSPEQARDSSAADSRSDLYSLGATWYHLLTGQAPFPEGGLGERLIKVMTEQPTDARELNDRVSDDTWFILSRLLEKDPDDRYQTPDDLIEALVSLEGSAVASSRTVRKPVRKKTARKPRADEDTTADAPATMAGDSKSNRTPYLVGGALAALAVAAVIVAVTWPKPPAKPSDDVVWPAPFTNPITVPPDDKDKPPPKDQDKPPDDKIKPPPVARAGWPALYKPAQKIDAAALREEVDRPFAAQADADPFVARVSRVGGAGSYRTLADAVAAAPAGRAIVLEIHDNGPLFEQPVRVEGRRLTVKAGEGFRPLVLWDLQATVDRRRRDKKTAEPLVMFTVARGGLELKGLELAFRWPEGLAEAVTLLDVAGDLSVTDCTVSAAGKPHEAVTLARVKAESPRCRFLRLHARGQALAALDLDAACGEVLFDGCLFNAGNATLVRAKGGNTTGAKLRFVRSTLVAKTLMALRPAAEIDNRPMLRVLAWDSLLAKSGQEDGDLLSLLDKATTTGIEWRTVNSLYVNWSNLLAGTEPVGGKDVNKWRELWKSLDGDEAISAAWPASPSSEPATQAAAAFAPNKAVGFASSINSDKPLGCDLAALPAARDAWVSMALEPNLTPVEPPEGGLPEIPELDDGCYHGGKFDLKGIDLGAELEKKLKAMKPGPKVVLHLSGKGDVGTSPIRLKGASLVIYFDEPADEKTPRPMLSLTGTDPSKVLIDVEGGSVEVINGGLKLQDKATARGAHLIRVKGGDVRLYRTRLEGPQTQTPGGWQSAVTTSGSGDPDKAFVCALNECVVTSSKAGVVLEGVGHRLLLRQTVLAAGGDAIVLRPGDCKGRTNVQCSLQQTTVAARSAIVHLGDASGAGVAFGPVLILSRDCAFLCPFATAKGGMLVCEGESLSRGLLLWQGERDLIDPRLWFLARQADAALPERREPAANWQRLWGSVGVKSARQAGSLWPASFDPKRWALERLAVGGREPAGADLERLGIRKH